MITLFIVICLDSLPHRDSQDFVVHGGRMRGKLIQTFMWEADLVHLTCFQIS